MNKKVLTLCAAMLLTGSLATINAESVLPGAVSGIELVNNGAVIDFDDNVTLKEGQFLLITENNVTINGNHKTLTGHLVITGNNVTVNDLNVVVKPSENSSVYKNAITVVAKIFTINGGTIKAEKGKFEQSNGVSIFPIDVAGKYVINNVDFENIKGFGNNFESTAIAVTGGNYTIVLKDVPDWSNRQTAKLTDFAKQVKITGCTFKECDINYSFADWTAIPAYNNIEVEPYYDQAGNCLNAETVQRMVTRASQAEGVTPQVVFKGTADEFVKIFGATTTNNNVAVQCTGDENGEGAANVLFGSAENPNDKPAINTNVKYQAWEKVFGYDLVEQETSDWCMLILTNQKNDVYAITADKTSKAASATQINNASDMSNYTSNSAALWKMTRGQESDGQYYYKFVNKDGVELRANISTGSLSGDAKKFAEKANAGIFYAANNALYNKGVVFAVNGSNLEVNTPSVAFGLYKTADNYFTGNQLIKRYGDYFTLGITYKNDKNQDVDVTGEFKGQLRPAKAVEYKNGEITITKAGDAEEFMLVNEKNEIIVIDLNNPLHQGSTTYGYAFKALPAKEYSEWKNTPALREKYDYQTKFQFAYDYNSDVTTETVSRITIAGLTMGLEEDNKQIKLVADYESKLLDEPTINIKLNAGNGITADKWLTTPSYYKVEVINKNTKAPHYGKVLGLSEGGYPAWVAPENVDLTKPEGQFAITWNGSNYVFTNRESKESNANILDGDLYKVAGETDVYAVVHSWAADNDTLRISPITTYKVSDGFKRFTAADLNANTYTVAMKSLMGDPFIIENHNDKHRLGLSADEYTEWRIEMPTVKLKDATDDFTRMAADTVTVEVPITYYVANQGWKTTTLDAELAENNSDYVYNANAALKICTYILKNTDTNEYLYGVNDDESNGNAYYVCDENKESTTLATRIAFKENGEGTVNLVPAYEVDYSGYGNWVANQSKYESEYANYVDRLHLAYQKIEGGLSPISEGGVLKDVNLYKATTSDLFVIAPLEAPTYKKLAQDDKIIISRVKNNDEVIYEAGEFAGINNRAAYKDIKPTLYVDTAYVNRAGNYTYQYLLGVRINRVDTTYKCNVPDHGTHRADTTYGEFLINMVDSAEANKDVHNNKFEYNGEYKLSFVRGYRTNDTLYFTNKAGDVISKLEVGNNDFNIAKFGFKMVDDNEFVIETATGYTRKVNTIRDENGHKVKDEVVSVETEPGYLRWVNGNLVVTKLINEAEHFTMEASDKEATANEEISAGNVVVAGVDGAVVVKGAEGKNVIVSTILGKVVANEVVSSDNATIAAPAGIVVVSVDGESFKVVVK